VVGVVTRSGRCKVCSHPQRERIEAALLARWGVGNLAAEYPGIGKYSLRKHEQECLPRMLRIDNRTAGARSAGRGRTGPGLSSKDPARPNLKREWR
jgi:hypothetical protein